MRTEPVTGKKIRGVTIAFSMKTTACGTMAADSAAENETIDNDRFQAYLNSFNTRVLEPAGYKPRYGVVDAGGTAPSCADAARAGALATQTDQAFAVLDSFGGGITRDPTLFSDLLTSAHSISIGHCDNIPALALAPRRGQPQRASRDRGIVSGLVLVAA